MDKHIADSKARQQLTKQFEQHHIPPERIILREGAPFNEYLATYDDIDIVLDPFPRTGGTTTAEALWMGVPVITLAGDRYVERISASKLTAIGLEDLITGNQEDYIDKAISLTLDTARRMELRELLRGRMEQSPLCDSASLAQAIESTYLTMWDSHLSKSHFSEAE
jgi:predicted O-linked N-acetylglucosamine transferase (SPINDLY family)